MCACRCGKRVGKKQKKKTPQPLSPVTLLKSVHQAGAVGHGFTASQCTLLTTFSLPPASQFTPLLQLPQASRQARSWGRPRGSAGVADFTHTCLASCLPVQPAGSSAVESVGLVWCRVCGGLSAA